jgi:hypothetical protein
LNIQIHVTSPVTTIKQIAGDFSNEINGGKM